jgi:predicted Ser/Thr protein kinase
MHNEPIGETFGGRYRILETIGQGGMGTVYKALDTRLQRLVALKTLRLSPDTEFMRRFLREAQAGARLSHPNILQIYDSGEAEGLPYLAVEYVEGRSLQQMLRENKLLDTDRAVEIARQVAIALAYAHRSSVVHRDVKPSNILISNEGRVVLLDFGLAIRPGAETLTRSHTVAGTPAYMSPEQVMGLPVDARSDIFSLGVVLYELLTGHRPFSGPNIFGHIIEQAPLPPEKLNSSLSRSLGKIVLKSLAKKPEHRFQTAEAFVVALANETGSGQYRHRTGIRRLVDFFRAAVRGDERKHVAVTCQRVEALLDSGEVGRARQEVDQALHRFPDNADVTALRVRVQREIKAQSAHRVGRSADETIQGSAREQQPERDQALQTAISHMGGNQYVEAQTLVDAIQDAVTDDQIIPYAPGSATQILPSGLNVGARLLMLNGSMRGRQFRLKTNFVIGLGSECDLELDDEGLGARQLAKICLENGRFYICRLKAGDSSLVAVNGIRAEKQELRDYDEIQIGRAIMLFIARMPARSVAQGVVMGEITVEARTRLLAFELTWEELTRSVRDG